MLANQFIGTGAPLITPFKTDGTVDFEALRKITNHVIDGGVEYIVALGTTSEICTLSDVEQNDIVRAVVEETKNRVPIVVGIGGNDTAECVETLKTFDFTGISGVLSVVPYYNKPTQEGIYQHYLAISEKVDIPQIIYNVPGRTSVNIEAETQLKIAEECKNVIATKEASGDFEQIMEVIKHSPTDFTVLSGDDTLAVPAIFAGAKGVVSVLSNYAPKMFSDCIRLARDGKVAEAMKSCYELFDLMQINFIESNPVPVKTIMQELGLIPNCIVRQPLVPIQAANLRLIKSVLQDKAIC